jgi:ubiquinone/menaquinone biosynthesis C-methylase UbiE
MRGKRDLPAGRQESKTSWGKHAKWYGSVVEEKGSYQKEVILPGVLKLLDLKAGEAVLDLACGEGFFAREFHALGANVLGVDAGAGLIALAQKKSPKDIVYRVSDAKNLSFLNDGAFDAVVIILALQNIDDLAPVLREARRVLKPSGRIVIVLNHPVFRIPKFSGWGWDEGQSLQYRKINRYMSELKLPIEMHPGDRPGDTTWSFHRPLSAYFKALKDAGFVVADLEEWVSPKKSQPGPKAKAENLARSEFPLFMAIRCEIKS